MLFGISPVVVQDFTQVGITYRGEIPTIQGRYYPLSIVVPIHGGEDHRKVGLMPTQVGITKQSTHLGSGQVPTVGITHGSKILHNNWG